jgi:hypothetical protein
MKKFIIKNREKFLVFQANLVFLAHCLIVFVIIFGWAFSELDIIYPIVLVATLILEIIFGYCILTEIEFRLRKKVEPNLDYDYSFLTYYMYKIYNMKISRRILDAIYKSFLVVSLAVYFYKIFVLR